MSAPTFTKREEPPAPPPEPPPLVQEPIGNLSQLDAPKASEADAPKTSEAAAPPDDDQSIQTHVDRVRDRIALLIEDGLADRRGWFA